MSGFFIRKATPNDVLQIENIEKSSFSMPWSQKVLLDEINKPDDLFWVIEDEKNVLGYAVIGVLGSEAEIYNIAVDSSHRGKGLGDMLVKHLVSQCAENGTEALFLEVRESNAPAKSLYEKYGFKAVGIRKNYYRKTTEDAILMMLSL